MMKNNIPVLFDFSGRKSDWNGSEKAFLFHRLEGFPSFRNQSLSPCARDILFIKSDMTLYEEGVLSDMSTWQPTFGTE